jgi:hypothetical protein
LIRVSSPKKPSKYLIEFSFIALIDNENKI